jgi:hypothetical protein
LLVSRFEQSTANTTQAIRPLDLETGTLSTTMVADSHTDRESCRLANRQFHSCERVMTAFPEAKQRQSEQSKPEDGIASRVAQLTTKEVQAMHSLDITTRSHPTYMATATVIASFEISELTITILQETMTAFPEEAKQPVDCVQSPARRTNIELAGSNCFCGRHDQKVSVPSFDTDLCRERRVQRTDRRILHRLKAEHGHYYGKPSFS